MNKTIVVEVHTYRQHAKYKKRFRITKTFVAHDENNTCQEGDTVTIAESIPLSKTKKWKVIEINGKSLEEASKASASKEKAPAAAPEVSEEAAESPEETN